MKLQHFMKNFIFFLLILNVFSCETTANNDENDFSFMNEAIADCQYDVLTFKTSDESLIEVSINDLPVQTFAGAEKLSADTVEIVERRGVSFKNIFEKISINIENNIPINIISRDGWDPLRTRLENDITKLPTFDFFIKYAYVYVGNSGDKDPLYPTMEGKTLIIDFDISKDEEVPAYLGGNLSAINIFRARMLEKIDEDQKGIIEINPIIKK